MIRILPLGGMGHVTRNLFVYEYFPEGGKNVERIIVDCGMGFPEEEMYGVDLLLPDVSYLANKKEDSIKGIILTHGHDDHIGGLPYILPKLGTKIPIYASALTAGFAEDALADYGIKEKVRVIRDRQPLHLGSFTLEFIAVTHSVPDSKHVVIETPEGIVYHGSDFKFDWTPVDGKRPDVQKIAEVGRRGILCLLTDCLRVEKEGYSLSEKSIGEGLERELRVATGKFIMTTMSSNIHRIQQIVDIAKNYDRKIAFVGRSFEENVRTAERLGFIHLPAKALVNKHRISKLPDKQQCLIVGGCQGQIDSTLVRISRNEHSLVKIKPGDRVVFATDPIPGNEQAVYQTIDNLARLGATVAYTDINDDLHVSGHASADELRLFLTLTKPKFILPIGGTFRHMNHFAELASGMGWLKENIFLFEDGDSLELSRGQAKRGNKITLKTVIVDGLGIGDVGKIILSERKKMAKAGMVVVAIPVDRRNDKVLGRPEVITRGFVFVKSAQDLIKEAEKVVAITVPQGSKIKDWQESKQTVASRLTQFFFEKTQRQPLILPVLVRA